MVKWTILLLLLQSVMVRGIINEVKELYIYIYIYICQATLGCCGVWTTNYPNLCFLQKIHRTPNLQMPGCSTEAATYVRLAIARHARYRYDYVGRCTRAWVDAGMNVPTTSTHKNKNAQRPECDMSMMIDRSVPSMQERTAE